MPPTLEFSCESPGAIVCRRQGQWFEIALDGGRDWVRSDVEAPYWPVRLLLEGPLAYLRTEGQGRISAEPCTGADTLPAPITGWLPLYGNDRLPAIWFHPRGC